MHRFTILMAVVDYISVVCFACAAVILMRDLYNKISKGAFALFSAGVLLLHKNGLAELSLRTSEAGK